MNTEQASAVSGEGLLITAAEGLYAERPLTYYEFRAIDCLLELLYFCDHLVVLGPSGGKPSSSPHLDVLRRTLADTTDLSIEVLTEKDLDAFLLESTLDRFREICENVYGHELGMLHSGLLRKESRFRLEDGPKDKIDDICVRIEDEASAAEGADALSQFSQRNQTEPALLRFFRAHLIQAIADSHLVTPVFCGPQLLAEPLHEHLLPIRYPCSLSLCAYRGLSRHLRSAQVIAAPAAPGRPHLSVAMSALLPRLVVRRDILKEAVRTRAALEPFRRYTRALEGRLTNPNASATDRMAAKSELGECVQRLWMPLSACLSVAPAKNGARTLLKRTIERLGIADMSFQATETPSGPEHAVAVSTASVVAAIAAAFGAAVEHKKLSRLLEPNQTLVDLFEEATSAPGLSDLARIHLPIQDLGERVPQHLEAFLVKAEVSE